MELNDNFELYLNHMGAWEHMNDPKAYEDYEQIVIHFLQNKGKHIFQHELMERYNAKDPEQLKVYGNYKEWGQKKYNGEWKPIYYCVLADYYVQRDDAMYEQFFAYRLRQIKLVNMDKFLDYQLKRYYHNNLKEFSRFVLLCVRMYEKKLLSPEIAISVSEWIEERKAGTPATPQEPAEPSRELSGQDEPMNIDEAAKFLKLKKATLYEKTSEQTIPHHKKGNKLYFYKSELEAWIKQGKVKTNGEIEGDAATYTLRNKK